MALENQLSQQSKEDQTLAITISLKLTKLYVYLSHQKNHLLFPIFLKQKGYICFHKGIQKKRYSNLAKYIEA